MAIRYVPGPEYSALAVVAADGSVMGSKNSDGVGYTLPDRADLDILLASFDPSIQFSLAPTRAGSAQVGSLTQLSGGMKRVAAHNLPAGTISKLRVWMDNPSAADAVVKGVLHNADGTVKATTNPTTVGFNHIGSLGLNGGTVQGTGVTKTLTPTTPGPITPTGALKIVTPGTVVSEGTTWSESGVWPYTVGEQITHSVYMRGAVGGETVKFEHREGDSANAFLTSSNSAAITLDTTWRRYTYAATIGNATTQRITQKVYTSGAAAAMSWFMDGAMVQRGSFLLPYSASAFAGGWVDLVFATPVVWGGGPCYLGVAAASDLQPGDSTVLPQAVAINGTFESNVTGWTPTAATATTALDTAQKHAGASSMRVDYAAAASGDGVRLTTTKTVSAGDKITAYYWARPSTPVNLGLQINAGAASNRPLLAGVANSWQLVSHSWVATTNGTLSVTAHIGTANYTGSVWVDDYVVYVQPKNSSRGSSARVQADAGVTYVNEETNPKFSQATNPTMGVYAGGGTNTVAVAQSTADGWFGTTSLDVSGTIGTGSNPVVVPTTDANDPLGASGHRKVSPGDVVHFIAAIKPLTNIRAISMNARLLDINSGYTIEPLIDTLSTVTLSRWHVLSGSWTVPADSSAGYVGLDLPLTLTTLASGQTWSARVGFKQIVVNPPATPVPIIDGDNADALWDGAANASKPRMQSYEVNHIFDPLTVRAASWSHSSCSHQVVADPSSPTGNALEAYGNTGVDPFLVPVHNGISHGDIGRNHFRARDGETWTLSGWIKYNADMLADSTATGTAYKFGPNIWYRVANGNYVTVAPPLSAMPQAADVWVPFAFSVTFPARLTETFVRLYNGTDPTGDPRTRYAGLKLQKGVWAAEDFWVGTFQDTVNGSASYREHVPEVPDGGTLLAASRPSTRGLSVQAVYQ